MIGFMKKLLFVLITQLFAPLVFADSGAVDLLQEVPVEEYDYWNEFVKMLVTLGFLIGLIFASIFILKRLLRSRSTHLNKAHGIRILEKRNLNQKSALYLVDVLGKGFVIGESANGLHVISSFPDGVDLDSLMESERAPSEVNSSLSKLLAKGMSKFKLPVLKKTKDQ